MADEKKKTTTKKSEPKKVEKKEKTKVVKKETPKATKAPIKKEEPKKVVPKKETESKKITPKKVEQKNKEVPKKVIESKKETEKKVNKRELLERTIIFDGEQKKNLEEVVKNLEKENVVLKDKVVKRSPLKKLITLILMVLIVVLIIITSIYLCKSILDNYGEGLEDETPVKTLNTNIYDKVNEYREDLNEEPKDDKKDNNKKGLITITLSEFEKKVLEKENVNIMVSSSKCLYCIDFEPTIEKVLKKNKKTIYKIDIAEFTKEENDRFREYYAYTIAPTIFTIKDGIVVSEKLGTMSEEELTKWCDINLQ